MLLIAYDGSPDAKRAIATAGRLFTGQAVVLHVQTIDVATGIVVGVGTTPAIPAVEDPQAQRESMRCAREGADLAKRAGLEAEPLAERSDRVSGVVTIVTRLAAERDVDAIVVGRRGMSKLRAVVLVVPEPGGEQDL